MAARTKKTSAYAAAGVDIDIMTKAQSRAKLPVGITSMSRWVASPIA